MNPSLHAPTSFRTSAPARSWPQPAWRHADGSWQPAYANFTSLATPNELGSGKTALVTLLHEGGHGALWARCCSSRACVRLSVRSGVLWLLLSCRARASSGLLAKPRLCARLPPC